MFTSNLDSKNVNKLRLMPKKERTNQTPGTSDSRRMGSKTISGLNIQYSSKNSWCFYTACLDELHVQKETFPKKAMVHSSHPSLEHMERRRRRGKQRIDYVHVEACSGYNNQTIEWPTHEWTWSLYAPPSFSGITNYCLPCNLNKANDMVSKLWSLLSHSNSRYIVHVKNGEHLIYKLDFTTLCNDVGVYS